MSTTGHSRLPLAEAAVGIQRIQTYEPGRTEQFLNTLGDHLAQGSDAASAIQNVAASEAFNAIKEQVSHFAENSKILMDALNEIGKVHPFIQIAVSAFKTAIKLELTRRENDQKVLALIVTMLDMMQVMTLLKHVAGPSHQGQDGVTVEQRLQRRMGGVVDSIKRCAELCNSYQKRHTFVKFFASLNWKTKFAEIAAMFDSHKSNLQFDLQFHTSITVAKTHGLVTSIDEKINDMNAMIEIVFARMQTPEERNLATLVDKRGGPECILNSVGLMKEVLETQNVATKGDNGSTSRKIKGAPTQPSLTLVEATKEIRKAVDTILAEDYPAFERKFGAIELSLKEMDATIQRQSDRVISTVLAGMQAGPHERIKDKDLYHIWKEMGWKGSVKATHFVIALHDHFTANAGQASRKTSTITNASAPAETVNTPDPDPTTAMSPAESPADDSWALQYINVRQVQPLIEAIDDDGSSFVTINELNDFTSCRPDGWSLPRWIAYGSFGFEMTTNWYWRRIHKNLVLIFLGFWNILPENRAAFRLDSSWSIESILSGLRGADNWDATDWEHDRLFGRFKDYVLDEERKLKTLLRRLAYNIDQDNTLQTLTGSDRPEKYAMPLLCLLLERVLWTMNTAKTSRVSPQEFAMLDESISVVVSGMRNRCLRLQAIYQLQNFNKEKLERTFFGLYSYISGWGEKNDHWTRFWSGDRWVREPDLGELEVPEPSLIHQARAEELDRFIESTTHTEGEIASKPENKLDEPSTLPSLIGAWSGTYEDQTGKGIDDLVSLSITEQKANGEFEGSGIDGVDAFTVGGTISGNKVEFTKTYTTVSWVWKYVGVLGPEMTEIVGRWGPPETEDEVNPFIAIFASRPGNENGPEERISPEPASPHDNEVAVEKGEEAVDGDDGVSEADSVLLGTWVGPAEVLESKGRCSLVRRPVDYFLYRPSDAEFKESRPKALWKMVSHAARQWHSSKYLVWDALRERRDRRNRYMDLLLKQEKEGVLDDPNEIAEWVKITRQTHPNDIHLWRAIAHYKQTREIPHSVSCDKCEMNISGSRFICRDCTVGGWSNSINLCEKCWTLDCSRESDDKHHISTHMLIQCRRPISRMEYHKLFWCAKKVVEDSVAKRSELSCVICENTIPEKPYWCCLDCQDTYVCTSCNTEDEAKKPWLLQRVHYLGDPHSVLDTLVLAVNSSVTSEPEPTTEYRLGQLEKKFEEQAAALRELHDRFENRENVMQEHMEEMFRLMHQVLAGRLQSGSG